VYVSSVQPGPNSGELTLAIYFPDCFEVAEIDLAFVINYDPGRRMSNSCLGRDDGQREDRYQRDESFYLVALI